MDLARGRGNVEFPDVRPATANLVMPSPGKTSGTQIDAMIARASKKSPSASDVDAMLADAKMRSRGSTREAEPQLDTVLTYLRKVPAQSMPSVAESKVSGDLTDVVSWDAWHAHFAQLARAPIMDRLGKVSNPAGSDTVEITVVPDHHLKVTIAKPSENKQFDRAIVEAYSSLDGNAGLAYPQGSRRKSITFLIDNEHKQAGTVSGVNSKTSIGDKEVILHHI